METWRNGDMETWRHGHGDMEFKKIKLKTEALAIFPNPFVSLSFVLLLTKKQTEVICLQMD
jgi:hypothetical protein